MYATVSNGQCESAIVEIVLTVTPAPTANPTTDTQCDDGSGTAIFDLTALNNTVNGNSGNPVSWFIDSNGSVPINNPSNFSSSGGIVYASVGNGICNSPLVEVLLVVNLSPTANPTSQSGCDDGKWNRYF